MNDMEDYRPGYKAIKELSVKSPLQAVMMYKKEIRRQDIYKRFNELGFNHVTLDLREYSKGSMNIGVK